MTQLKILEKFQDLTRKYIFSFKEKYIYNTNSMQRYSARVPTNGTTCE